MWTKRRLRGAKDLSGKQHEACRAAAWIQAVGAERNAAGLRSFVHDVIGGRVAEGKKVSSLKFKVQSDEGKVFRQN